MTISFSILATICIGLLTITFLALAWLQYRDTVDPSLSSSTSPVSWMDNKVWSSLNNSEPLTWNSKRFKKPLVENPTAIRATQADRQRVPHLATTSSDLPPISSDSMEELQQALGSIQSSQPIKQPVWPVCCDTLAVLHLHQPNQRQLLTFEHITGPLDHAFLERELQTWGDPSADRSQTLALGWQPILEQLRQNDHSGAGLNIFHCFHCHAVYIASCQT